eukprot:10411020-Alexandrium_andersonii.AAC.1
MPSPGAAALGAAACTSLKCRRLMHGAAARRTAAARDCQTQANCRRLATAHPPPTAHHLARAGPLLLAVGTEDLEGTVLDEVPPGCYWPGRRALP